MIQKVLRVLPWFVPICQRDDSKSLVELCKIRQAIRCRILALVKTCFRLTNSNHYSTHQVPPGSNLFLYLGSQGPMSCVTPAPELIALSHGVYVLCCVSLAKRIPILSADQDGCVLSCHSSSHRPSCQVMRIRSWLPVTGYC